MNLTIYVSWRTWSEARTDLTDILSEKTLLVLDQAFEFAMSRHGNQTRPAGQPYIEHLLEALEVLVRGPGIKDEAMLVASALHDVVEDTPTTIEEVADRFGEQVADLVRWVTKPEASTDLTGKEQKKLYLDSLQEAPEEALAVKLADRVSNVQCLDTHPKPVKQRRYYQETIDYLLPLSERIPWYKEWFQSWRVTFERLEVLSELIDHSNNAERRYQFDPHAYILTYHDLLASWLRCECGCHHDKEQDNEYWQYHRMKFELLVKMFEIPLKEVDRSEFPTKKLPSQLHSALNKLAHLGTHWDGMLAYTFKTGEEEIQQRHEGQINGRMKDLKRAYLEFIEELLLHYCPHLKNTHFPFQTLLDQGLPNEAPDPYDYV